MLTKCLSFGERDPDSTHGTVKYFLLKSQDAQGAVNIYIGGCLSDNQT